MVFVFEWILLVMNKLAVSTVIWVGISSSMTIVPSIEFSSHGRTTVILSITWMISSIFMRAVR